MGHPGVPTTGAAAQYVRGRWLLLARAAWVAVLALTLGLFAAGIPTIVVQLQEPCAGEGCYRWQPTPELAADLAGRGLSLGDYAAYMVTLDGLFVLGFCAIAAVIVLRRPEEPMALFAAFTLVTFGPAFSNTILAFGLSAPLWWWPRTALACLGWSALFVFFYLFPDGRFVPRWTRWAALAWVVYMVLSYFSPPSWLLDQGTSGAFGTSESPLFYPEPFFASVVVAQVYRYWRVSTPAQRQQTKWVVYGFVAAFGGLILNIGVVGQLISPNTLVSVLVSLFIFYAVLLSLPLSIGVAILRYRLWEIDFLINRTLVYGALTACVVGIYVLVVGYLGALFKTDENLAISLVATGIVAVLFAPLRDRLQRGANRLMYGERDEPYKVLSRLGQRLESTLSPEAVLPTVVRTAAEALKLPYAAVELKRDGGFRIAATTGSPTSGPLRLPLLYGGEEVGHLVLGRRAGEEGFAAADRRLLDDLARQIGVAVHATLLTEEALHLSADLQRSRERLVTAREEERRRLRRDLHDGLGPQLASLTMKAEAARDLLPINLARADALLGDLVEQTQAAVADVRRLVYALRPPALDALGLIGALRMHAANHDHGGVRVTVEAPEQLPPLPAAVEVAAYRIVLEALNNVVRHADARNCVVRLALEEAAGTLSLEIVDDGRGIGEDRGTGVGLASMRERAAELGGSCAFEAVLSGGTRVRACLPGARDGAADEAGEPDLQEA